MVILSSYQARLASVLVPVQKSIHVLLLNHDLLQTGKDTAYLRIANPIKPLE